MALVDSAPSLSAPEAPTSVVPAGPTPAQPAGFWIRVGATLVDGIATLLIGVAPVAVASGMTAPRVIVALAGLLLLFMCIGYAPVMLACNGAQRGASRPASTA